MEYRVENKYLVTDFQIAYLSAKLSGFMEKDKHGKDGKYLIRSLYFDDMNDSCLEANRAGVDYRYKYRIRTYDNSKSLIHLEEKSKIHGFTKKITTEIGLEESMLYIDADTCARAPMVASKIMNGNSNPELSFLQKKLLLDMQIKLMHPVVTVEYERTAYVCDMGNVRVTFDRNIGGCRNIHAFFEKDMPVIPVLPPGVHVMEVKYDELLPDYIREIIDTGEYQKISYSKYCQAREACDGGFV